MAELEGGRTLLLIIFFSGTQFSEGLGQHFSLSLLLGSRNREQKELGQRMTEDDKKILHAVAVLSE